MSICIIKQASQLGVDFTLTPERYNPNRRMNSEKTQGCLLSDFAMLISDVITTNANKKYYQINTSDAVEGYLNIPDNAVEIGSNKKRIETGDVIISRLRPYLRQVAYVDYPTSDKPLAASTEFYVLRSKNKKSIAFLVPFLLSDKVQNVFKNSVEGSQHPRFKEEDLLSLIVPATIMESSQLISAAVEQAIEKHRCYEKELNDCIGTINSTLE